VTLSPALKRWCATKRRYDQALAEVVATSAGEPAEEIPAALELLRLSLHRQLDDVIDAEALKHPSPHKLIGRTPTWYEMFAELSGRGVPK